MTTTLKLFRIDQWLDSAQKSVSKHLGDGHWLSNERTCSNFIVANTVYRKNFHRFATEYLGLQLYWYQCILLYFMGISVSVVIIAARAAAKSFIIAIYACCKCILFPGSKIIITSGTRGQSRLIVTEKIQGILMPASANLRREIEYIKDNQNEVHVQFRNGSYIETVTCSASARGHRSTVNIGEEAREINKGIMDTVIGPFKEVRQVAFMKLDAYKEDIQFREEPMDIYLSSSFPESHWLYKLSKQAWNGTLKENRNFFIAFDYAITLKHGIKTPLTLQQEKDKIDPITWAVEYENLVLRSGANAYFSYDLVHDCQSIQKAFYPRTADEVLNRVKSSHTIPKQDGEVRIISCDMAFINRNNNDNSAFSCLRLLPETVFEGDKKLQTFRIQIPYLEGNRGAETRKQAIRIRQLFADFDADYIVLDMRNGGIAVADTLARVLYDDERGVEYAPIKCMNDDVVANRVVNPNAESILYCISASAKLNDAIARNLRHMMTDHILDLLVTKDDADKEIKRCIASSKGHISIEDQVFFEKPYVETMLLVNELINLEYEKGEATGLIRIREKSGMMKDRYSSVSYGAYFAFQLAIDLLNQTDDLTFEQAAICVSSIQF